MTIGLYSRTAKENDVVYLKQIYDILKADDVDLILYEPYYRELKKNKKFKLQVKTFSNSAELISNAYYLISLGGDGTMLETVNLVKKSGIPILGVNTGRLGFLASVNKDDLELAMRLLLDEKFTLDKRELIKIKGCGDAFNEMNYALNEFAIHKPDGSSMINIETYVDDIYLNTYFADGLIVSTPTGSTAYSLSCGGPIMMPDSENFIITPIAPHNLSVRPIVVSNDKELRFKVSGRSNVYNVSLDARSAQVTGSSEITLRKAHFRLNLIYLDGQHFFTTLRNKLMWGLDKRH